MYLDESAQAVDDEAKRGSLKLRSLGLFSAHVLSDLCFILRIL
jgi:hypothetical protein